MVWYGLVGLPASLSERTRGASGAGWGKPPCLAQCVEDNAMMVAALLLLPVLCRVLDFYASSLKEQMGGADEDDSKKKKKKQKKDKKKSSARSPKYSALDSEKTKDFTMKLLVNEEDLSFSNVVDEYGWDSAGEAYMCAAARMLCHLAQPVLYVLVFSLATPDGDGGDSDRLQGLSLVCGWCVALREAAYLVATLGCALKNPAFLLINVPATVNGKDDDDSLCSGMTFLMAYVCSPQSFVLKVLCGKGGLDLDNEARLILAGSFFLDLFAVAAFGSTVGDGPVSLGLTGFYAATAVGGIGAGVAYSQRDESKLGPICMLLAAVAAGGGWAIGSNTVELASLPTAVICAAELALGYVAFEKAGGGSGDDSDSGDSGDESSDDQKAPSKDNSDTSSDDSSDSGGSDDNEKGKPKKFKVFDKVQVYSQSNKVWCDGEVVMVDPVAGTVKAEYFSPGSTTKMQKVLLVDSEHLKLKKGGRSSGSSPVTRPRRMSTGALRREMSRLEAKDDFTYQVRAEFKKGKTGFSFKEDENGEVYVNKVAKKTPAADVPHACPGMILRFYETKPKGRWKKKKLKGDEDYKEVKETIEDTRPIRLYFDHPWQYEPGKKGKRGRYYNWFDDIDQVDSPPELEKVFESMSEWMDGEGTTDPYDSPGKGQLWPTSTLRPYRCTVKETTAQGAFSKTMYYTIKCEWNSFVGESKHRYSGAYTPPLPACCAPELFAYTAHDTLSTVCFAAASGCVEQNSERYTKTLKARCPGRGELSCPRFLVTRGRRLTRTS